MRARLLGRTVIKARKKRQDIMDQIVAKIQQALEQHQINAHVSGKEKNLYSIYQKIKTQRRSLSEIMDMFNVKVITQSVDDCLPDARYFTWFIQTFSRKI